MKKVLSVSEIAEQKRSKYFPFKISKTITCDIATDEELDAAYKKYGTKVFAGGFQTQLMIPPKFRKGIQSTREEYKKIHQEKFVFKNNGKIIGWSYGEMEDFETFYMRNTGIIPAFQNQKIYSKFLTVFLKYITAIGYQRISSQHAQWNDTVISTKMKAGFIIVGSENHDRWGSLIKLVKFTEPSREKKFKTIF